MEGQLLMLVQKYGESVEVTDEDVNSKFEKKKGGNQKQFFFFCMLLIIVIIFWKFPKNLSNPHRRIFGAKRTKCIAGAAKQEAAHGKCEAF